jgi:phosphoglycolate phosphatase-like HAD superfamily hydrolase
LHIYNKPKFEKVIYFGDGLWDYECAKKLNIHFIGVDIDNNNQLKKTNAQFVTNNFYDYEMIFKYIEIL